MKKKAFASDFSPSFEKKTPDRFGVERKRRSANRRAGSRSAFPAATFYERAAGKRRRDSRVPGEFATEKIARARPVRASDGDGESSREDIRPASGACGCARALAPTRLRARRPVRPRWRRRGNDVTRGVVIHGASAWRAESIRGAAARETGNCFRLLAGAAILVSEPASGLYVSVVRCGFVVRISGGRLPNGYSVRASLPRVGPSLSV